MPQSFSRVLVHVTFSTRERRAFLDGSVCVRLHAYLATVLRGVGCEFVRVGGVEDHVHMAVDLPRTLSIANLVEKAKTSSTKWLKTQSEDLEDFAWQRGYAAFSIAPADVDVVCRYIERQAEHHRKQSFEDELRAFLKKYGVEHDERYMWD